MVQVVVPYDCKVRRRREEERKEERGGKGGRRRRKIPLVSLGTHLTMIYHHIHL